MRTVQRFIADDGSEFVSAEACLAYEAMANRIAKLIGQLVPIPELPGCGFQNGDGYLQHDPEVARNCRIELLKLANELMPHKWFLQSIETADTDPSWAGRLIDDIGRRCLGLAWHRFMCMTPDWREYGQPYYRLNPKEAKDICLNQQEDK